jgi:DNA-binding LacI/PurR family transcriptional regulator
MASRRSQRPTLRLVAEEAGISLAATSMALRNHPRISEQTRQKVQEIAQRLGYRPDPQLATLMQHLRSQKAVDYRETLGFINNYRAENDWKWLPQYDLYYLGAAERALNLGYRLDVFHAATPGMTPRRLSQQLSSRGIRGLLIGGFKEPNASLALKWDQFASLTFDFSLVEPGLHRVTANFHLNMQVVLHELERVGCKRIGLVAKSDDDAKVLGLWHSAYLLYQERQPRSRQIPINTVTERKMEFESWLKRHRPDAIVSAGVCDFPQDYERVHHQPAPTDIRYANLNIAYTDGRSCGIDKHGAQLGRLACEQLIAQLQRNETGLPEHPQLLSLDGQWVEDYDAWKKSLEQWRQSVVRKLQRESVLNLDDGYMQLNA